MKVRIVLSTFALVVWATIHLAEAQQPKKVPRVGLLISASDVIAPFTDAFRQGLRELGYVEGKNYVLEIRGGGAEPDRLSDLAAELVGLKVDIIKEGAQALIVIPSPRYAIERGAWADAAALEPRPSTPAADAITYFTRAMGAVRKGDTASAQRDVEQLESLKNTLTKSKQKYWADQVEIQRRAAAAWVAQAEGKKNEALKLMRSAAALEDASEKHVAMENRLWPMRELLGEMLLQLNEPAQALKEFEASFKAAPNRFRGYYGAAKAAERLGDEKKTKIYYEKLVELCRQADTERPEMVEAKAFLAKK
jgi:tetratricopeptide (TPR) repeat protein